MSKTSEAINAVYLQNKDEFEMAENINDIYKMCKEIDSSITLEEFEEEMSKISENDLEKITGGKLLDKNISKKMASLMLATSSIGGMTSMLNSPSTSAKTSIMGFDIYSTSDVSNLYNEKYLPIIEKCEELLEKLGPNKELEKSLKKFKNQAKELKNSAGFFSAKSKYNDLQNLISKEGKKLKSKILIEIEEQSNQSGNIDNIEEKQNERFEEMKSEKKALLNRTLSRINETISNDELKNLFQNDFSILSEDAQKIVDDMQSLKINTNVRDNDLEKFENNLTKITFETINEDMHNFAEKSKRILESIANQSEQIKMFIVKSAKEDLVSDLNDVEEIIREQFIVPEGLDDNKAETLIFNKQKELLEEVSKTIDSVKSINTLIEKDNAERTVRLFKTKVEREIIQKDKVMNKILERVKRENYLESIHNFDRQLEMLRSGQLELSDVVGGYENVIENLQKLVNQHRKLLNTPDTKISKIKPSTGLLLYGLPGTGKTTMVKALAASEKCGFVMLKRPSNHNIPSSKEIVSKFEEAISLTNDGKDLVVLLIDEIDALGAVRIPGVTDKETVDVLTQIDRIRSEHPAVVVIATTNLKNSIDSAVLRSERIEQSCEMLPPTSSDIRKIFQIAIKGYKLDPTQDIDSITNAVAGKLEGLSGADIKRAVEIAIQENMERTNASNLSSVVLSKPDILKGIEAVKK